MKRAKKKENQNGLLLRLGLKTPDQDKEKLK